MKAVQLDAVTIALDVALDSCAENKASHCGEDYLRSDSSHNGRAGMVQCATLGKVLYGRRVCFAMVVCNVV